MLAPQMASQPATGHVLARPSTSLAPRLVILGGGFAGVTTALELAKRCARVLPVHLTLVSEHNFFLFTPMLAEAAIGAVETRHILYPIRTLCGVWGIEFGEMSVETIDLGRRRLIARHRRSPVRQQVHYDKLVLALGAAPNVATVPGAAEHALTFKAVGDAVRIRNHVIDLFEAAALNDDPWARQRLLTFVVVGGPRGHRADGRPGGADARHSAATLPLDTTGRHPPRAGRERRPPPNRHELGHLHERAAPQPGDRAGDGSGGRGDGRWSDAPGRTGDSQPLRHLDRREPRQPCDRRAPSGPDAGRPAAGERVLRGRGGP